MYQKHQCFQEDSKKSGGYTEKLKECGNTIHLDRQLTVIRDSGIELLKIIAIFLIVISHVVQTLTAENPNLSYNSYIVDISSATTDVQTIILLILRHFGVWGNSLFFVCSAWFLLKSTAYKKKKWFSMLLEIWVVSIIILIITFFLLHGNISSIILIKSVFPTLFGNNWYMTCYLLFYPIHPILNGIIKRMNQVELFRTMTCLSVLYILLDFIKGDWFFSSSLILWLTIYFVMAYIQNYLMKYADSIKWNVLLFVINAFFFVGIILLTEFGGLHISFLSEKMTHWNNNCNPFLIFMSIAMFNIARNIHFKNRFINYISSLSLLIYIIHENLILRTYYRPAMWDYIHTQYGYSHVIGWTFILVIIIFLFGIVAAAVYTATIQKAVSRISNRMYIVLRNGYLYLESKLTKIG